jgi:hypothetical protein
VHRERTGEQFKRGIPSRIGPIEAAPMPILASFKPNDTELAAQKKPKRLKRDAPKPIPNKPTPPKPGSQTAAPEANPASGNIAFPSPKDATPPVPKAAPTEAFARLEPSTPPQFSRAVDAQTKEVSEHSAERVVETEPAAVEQVASPAGERDFSKSRPSTFATAAVSVLSTLVAVRAARWFGKRSKR